MKKMIHLSAAYLIFGLLTGLFYHEASYYMEFTGSSVLRLVHAHAFGLGTLVFFFLPVLMQVFHIKEDRAFRRFLYTYNVGLLMTLGFMTLRGVTELFSLSVSSFWDHMIGGLAGIGHVILSFGIFFLFQLYLSAVKKNQGGQKS